MIGVVGDGKESEFLSNVNNYKYEFKRSEQLENKYVDVMSKNGRVLASPVLREITNENDVSSDHIEINEENRKLLNKVTEHQQ
jgi:hypothetical protein